MDSEQFVYGDQNCNDFGWGCAYRCCQTSVYKAKGVIPDIEEMKAFFGLLDKSGVGLWLEPVDLCKYITSTYSLQTEHIGCLNYFTGISNFHRTAPETFQLFTTDGFIDYCTAHLRKNEKNSITIDNGTCTFNLLGLVQTESTCDRSTRFILGDPHKSKSNCKHEVDLKSFLGLSTWLACLVHAS